VRSREGKKRLFIAAILFAIWILAWGELAPARDRAGADPLETGVAAAADTAVGDADVQEPPVPDEPVWKVVVDPGHGGEDPGATGASGRVEKDFTLQLSLEVMKLLEQEPNIEVKLTRVDDAFLSSVEYERAQFANALEADLFVSIHGNTYEDPDVSGTETYYYDEPSLALASALHRHVVAATGFRGRGVRRANYFVLRETTMPAALIEVGYLTNPEEERTMWEESFQHQVAVAVVEGIKEYLAGGVQAERP
jgi:N-acetylmuramoyl-L-alanine amidase